jgi:hypothetical protein
VVVVNFLRAVARRSLLNVGRSTRTMVSVAETAVRELQSSCEREGLPLDSFYPARVVESSRGVRALSEKLLQ